MDELKAPLPHSPEEYLNSEIIQLCLEIEDILSLFNKRKCKSGKTISNIEKHLYERDVDGEKIFSWSPLYPYANTFSLYSPTEELIKKKYTSNELTLCYNNLSKLHDCKNLIMSCKTIFSANNEHSIRTMEISSTRDKSGNRVRFIDQKFVSEQMKLLSKYSAASYRINKVFKAIYCFYTFLVIHPFYDGNGRTSRGLFNWLLIQEGIIDIPIVPIGIYKIKSNNFFEVCFKKSFVSKEPNLEYLVKYFYSIIWDLHCHEYSTN